MSKKNITNLLVQKITKVKKCKIAVYDCFPQVSTRKLKIGESTRSANTLSREVSRIEPEPCARQIY